MQPEAMSSPRVGEEVTLSRDVLVEVARTAASRTMVWRLVERGTRGKIVGWRDASRAIVVIEGDRRMFVYVSEHHVQSIDPRARLSRT
jgi:hypothetical protein